MSRAVQIPYQLGNLEIHELNDILRQIQLDLNAIQINEHKHAGTEVGDPEEDELQIVESSITPPVLKASKNNYNPDGLKDATIVRISASSAVNITGFKKQPAGTIKRFFNYGTFNITLKDNSALSLRANRFELDSDLIITPNTTVSVQYDGESDRWRSIGAAPGIGSIGTAGQVAFFDGVSSLVGDTDFTFSTDTLSVDNITLPATTATEGIIRSASNLLLHTFGTSNTFLGVGAGNLTLTGNTNTGLGTSALTALTSGTTNSAFGYQALKACTEGTSNMAIGGNALLALTTGDQNVAIGEAVLQAATTVNEIVGIGANCLISHTSGTEVVGIGYEALTANTSGGSNTAIGYKALKANTTNGGSTAIGRRALIAADAAGNTAVGNAALFSTTSGGNNVALGEAAGFTLTTGSSCTFLGADADTSVNSITKSIAIGRNAIVGASNSCVIGAVADAIKVGIGTTTPGAQLDVIVGAATTIGQIIKGAASQSANLQEWQNSSSGVLSLIDATGQAAIGGSPLSYSGYHTLTIGNTTNKGLLKLRSPYNSGDGAEIFQITSGNLLFNINSGLTSLTLTVDGGAIFNEDGADVDFRIESDSIVNAFFLDGTTGNIGIGTTPTSLGGDIGTLDIRGHSGSAGAGVAMGSIASQFGYVYADSAFNYLSHFTGGITLQPNAGTETTTGIQVIAGGWAKIGTKDGPLSGVPLHITNTSSNTQLLLTRDSTGHNSSDGVIHTIDSGNHARILNQENAVFDFGTNNTSMMGLTKLGNLLIGGDSLGNDAGTGSKGIIFEDGTALASLASNTAGIYANDVGGTVEMFVINEAGAAKQLTGHGTHNESDFIDASLTTLPWENAFTPSSEV
jgi:hypothetical protein